MVKNVEIYHLKIYLTWYNISKIILPSFYFLYHLNLKIKKICILECNYYFSNDFYYLSLEVCKLHKQIIAILKFLTNFLFCH